MRSTTIALVTLSLLAASAHADLADGNQSCVCRVGDVNKDGRDDLLVASRDGEPETVWLLCGATGEVLLAMHGVQAGDGFGACLAAAWDVDQDGVLDFLVGALGLPSDRIHDARNPRAYAELRSGADGRVLRHLEPRGGPTGDRISLAVGMLDPDEVPDVVLGVGSRWGNRLVAYSGKDGSEFFGESLQTGDMFGRGVSVALLADRNADGWGEIALGEPDAESAPAKSSPGKERDHDPWKSPGVRPGRVRLLSGRDRAVLAEAWGEQGGDTFGSKVVRFGDASRDGVPDLLVAAESRYVRILSGKDLSRVASVDARGRRSIVDAFGSSLDAFGDLDEDDYPDFLVGADESLPGFFDEGYALLLSGKDARRLRLVYEDREYGVDVACAGRIDEDGVQDIALVLHGRVARPEDRRDVLRLVSGKDGRVIREVELRTLRREKEQTAK